MVRMPSLAAALAAAFLAVASMADRSAGGGRTVAVDAGWIAEPPPGASAAAGYVLIGNDASQDDVLLAARTAIARRTELHVTAVDDSGTMRMRAARDGMGIAGGGRLVLEPGGSHLMFIGPDGASASRRRARGRADLRTGRRCRRHIRRAPASGPCRARRT